MSRTGKTPVYNHVWYQQNQAKICPRSGENPKDFAVPVNSGNGLLPWHQAITWTNVDFTLVRFCGIHLQEQFHSECPYSWSVEYIALASHLCTCVLHRQLCYLHTLKLPKFFNFHGDFHQKWHFAHPEVSFAHPELPFLAKSMVE